MCHILSSVVAVQYDGTASVETSASRPGQPSGRVKANVCTRSDGRTDDEGRSAALILTEIEGGQAAARADRAALHNFNCF